MTEKPILFSGPMVRAILEGRKTQTRRVIKPQPILDQGYDAHEDYGFDWKGNEDGMSIEQLAKLCPFGKPGDRLWVRETFCPDWTDKVIYRADGGSAKAAGYLAEPRWRPSIHMPRWASRITLEITNVRVERLQDISEKDAIAEGNLWGQNPETPPPSGQFRNTWEYLYGFDSWNANPWVWVVEFERILK